MMMGAYVELAIGGICVVLLGTAAVGFWKAAKERNAIETALRSGQRSKRLGLFSLTGSKAIDRLRDRDLVIPEKLWTYDRFYLEKFAKAANRVQMADGGTALYHYSGGAMKWDKVFAACLGLFVALAEGAAATFLLPPGWPSEAVLFFAGMGFVYGAADVAEDFKLSTIFQDWERDEKAAQTDSMAPEHPARKHDRAQAKASGLSQAPVALAEDGLVFDERGIARGKHTLPIGKHDIVLVDGGEAAAANALTRIKFVAIALSILGALIYLLFAGITSVFLHRGPTTGSTVEDRRPVATQN